MNRSTHQSFRGQGSGAGGQRPGIRDWGLGIRNPRSEPFAIHYPPSPFRLHPSAFTLVELLVVVTIISMLVGLLVPAVIAARGRARVAQCTNNQREIGSAILQYESAKKRLPGYANRLSVAGPTPKSIAVTWVPVLLPFLGRNDLWEGNPAGGFNGWRSGAPSNVVPGGVFVNINQLVCPDDSTVVDYALTYVVNIGDTRPPLTVSTEHGLFRETVTSTAPIPTPKAKTISLTRVKSPSRRPMISERILRIGAAAGTAADRQWTAMTPIADESVTAQDIYMNDLNVATPPLTPAELGFWWPGTSGEVVGNNAVLPPIHPGIVIVTFCDGHVESLSRDTDCEVYDWQPIP
jgi:prepilin-type N-terminal cleavage/methylation domain-containing protein/prepilin-type processing-associated H-X9-DG protein